MPFLICSMSDGIGVRARRNDGGKRRGGGGGERGEGERGSLFVYYVTCISYLSWTSAVNCCGGGLVQTKRPSVSPRPARLVDAFLFYSINTFAVMD